MSAVRLGRACFTFGVAGALSLSVSFSDGKPAIAIEAASADTSTCAPACDRAYKACVDQATARAKVRSCYTCCKETEREGRVGFDTHPSREKLEEHMFDSCVTTLEAHAHPEWFSAGFPRSYRAALAYTPARAGLAAELASKYARPQGAAGGEPTSADASACTKGCSHRPRAAMAACTVAHTSCRRACAPAGTKC